MTKVKKNILIDLIHNFRHFSSLLTFNFLLLLFSAPAFAAGPYLVCDPYPNAESTPIVAVQVRFYISGTPTLTDGTYTVDGDHVILYDFDGANPANISGFAARWSINIESWGWSPWSAIRWLDGIGGAGVAIR